MGRAYDNSRRAEAAALTRRRIIDAATRLFSEAGYAGTRMASIAAAAGVSLDTVNANGPKAAILQAAVEVASFGSEGDKQVLAVDLGRSLSAAPDAAAFADVFARELWDFNGRVGPLWATLVSESLVDPDLAARRETMLAAVGASADAVVRMCSERGWATGTLGHAEMVMTIMALGSADTHARARAAGWDAARYLAWLRDGILRTLRT